MAKQAKWEKLTVSNIFTCFKKTHYYWKMLLLFPAWLLLLCLMVLCHYFHNLIYIYHIQKWLWMIWYCCEKQLLLWPHSQPFSNTKELKQWENCWPPSPSQLSTVVVTHLCLLRGIAQQSVVSKRQTTQILVTKCLRYTLMRWKSKQKSVQALTSFLSH